MQPPWYRKGRDNIAGARFLKQNQSRNVQFTTQRSPLQTTRSRHASQPVVTTHLRLSVAQKTTNSQPLQVKHPARPHNSSAVALTSCYEDAGPFVLHLRRKREHNTSPLITFEICQLLKIFIIKYDLVTALTKSVSEINFPK